MISGSLQSERPRQNDNIGSSPEIQRSETMTPTPHIAQNRTDDHHRSYNETVFQLGIGVLVVRHASTGRGVKDSLLRGTRVQFHFADWFLRWGINIAIGRELGQVKVVMRPYHTVPTDSAIFKACALGDDQTVARLIRDGEASPFDITEQGITPLHVRRHRLMNLPEYHSVAIECVRWLTYLVFHFRWLLLGFTRI
jgi:hypothetical protein